jgi:hypothetical protein
MAMIRYTDINTGNNLTDEGLENYLMRGFQPGGFLTAVLANDLRLAVGRADHWNLDNLPRIVKEVTFKMPSISWGSYAAVKDWCQDADGRQTYYREQKEKEYTWRVLKGEIRDKEPQDPPF